MRAYYVAPLAMQLVVTNLCNTLKRPVRIGDMLKQHVESRSRRNEFRVATCFDLPRRFVACSRLLSSCCIDELLVWTCLKSCSDVDDNNGIHARRRYLSLNYLLRVISTTYSQPVAFACKSRAPRSNVGRQHTEPFLPGGKSFNHF